VINSSLISSGALLDTAGLVALAVTDDRWHVAAKAAFEQLRRRNVPLLVTDLILTELADGLAAVRLRSLACEMRARLSGSPMVQVFHVDEDLHRRGWERYVSRIDKEWGHTDCVSSVLMEELGVRDAFTVDHHFRQAGFNCLIQSERP
jgi:uncharacterized protein